MYCLIAYSTNLKIILQYGFFLTLQHLCCLKNHVESRPLLMPGTPPTTGHTQRPASEHSFEGYRKLPGDKRRKKVSQDLKRGSFVSAATALGNWTPSSLTFHQSTSRARRMGCWMGRSRAVAGTGTGWQECQQQSSEEGMVAPWQWWNILHRLGAGM